MKVRQTLSTATKLVLGARAKSHGPDLKASLQVTADLWSAFLGVPVSADQAAMMMALLKIGRTASGQKRDDNYVDGAAYLAIANQVKE